MKKFKKIFAVLLTLAMVLGMSMTSFAAPNKTDGKITVTGLQPDVKVSYAQILKQDDTTSAWVFADGVGDAIEWSGGSQMTVESLAKEDAALQNLMGLNKLTYGTPVVANAQGNVEFSNMPAGLYAIKAVDPNNAYVYSYMIANVVYDADGNLTSVPVAAKGQTNVPKKEANTGAVANGENVDFTVTVKYPTFKTSSEEKRMTIVDTVTNGTIVEGTVLIKGGFASKFTAPTLSADKKTLTIELLADKYDSDLAGQDVEITYTVKADNAVYNAVENKVISTVPDRNGNNTANQAIVKLPNVSAEITKVDEKDAVITSSTATFELYKADQNGAATIKVYDASNPDGTEIKATLVDTKTTIDGKVTFTGLDPQATYYVKETAAPNGYSVEPLARKLTGAALDNGTTTEKTENGVTTTTTEYTATNFTGLEGFDGTNFVNTKLGSLPSTGGIGTTIFTIGGCAIMIIAAALFFASRRKSSK